MMMMMIFVFCLTYFYPIKSSNPPKWSVFYTCYTVGMKCFSYKKNLVSLRNGPSDLFNARKLRLLHEMLSKFKRLLGYSCSHVLCLVKLVFLKCLLLIRLTFVSARAHKVKRCARILARTIRYPSCSLYQLPKWGGDNHYLSDFLQMFRDIQTKGSTRFSIDVTNTCTKCFNIRLLKVVFLTGKGRRGG